MRVKLRFPANKRLMHYPAFPIPIPTVGTTSTGETLSLPVTDGELQQIQRWNENEAPEVKIDVQ